MLYQLVLFLKLWMIKKKKKELRLSPLPPPLDRQPWEALVPQNKCYSLHSLLSHHCSSPCLAHKQASAGVSGSSRLCQAAAASHTPVEVFVHWIACWSVLQNDIQMWVTTHGPSRKGSAVHCPQPEPALVLAVCCTPYCHDLGTWGHSLVGSVPSGGTARGVLKLERGVGLLCYDD